MVKYSPSQQPPSDFLAQPARPTRRHPATPLVTHPTADEAQAAKTARSTRRRPSLGGSIHEVGTARMSASPKDGVLNRVLPHARHRESLRLRRQRLSVHRRQAPDAHDDGADGEGVWGDREEIVLRVLTVLKVLRVLVLTVLRVLVLRVLMVLRVPVRRVLMVPC